MKKSLSGNKWWFLFMLTYLISWPIWVMGREIQPENLAGLPYSGKSSDSPGTAIMTYVSSAGQERLIWAMIKSVRELGGSYRNSKIFIVLADQNNQPCNSLKGDNIELLPLQMDTAFADYPLAVKAFAAAQVEKRDNQHGKLPSDRKITYLNELKIIIFDYAWAKIPSWENMILSHEPLKSWLRETYLEYLNK